MASYSTSVIVKVVLALAFILTSFQLLRHLDAPPFLQTTSQTLQKPFTNDSSEEAPHEAKAILAAELLSRPSAKRLGYIPKIFHQSWKSLELPAKFQDWSSSCRQRHNTWDWVVWTDEDNLKLVQQHFPWLEETYRGLPSVIYQADLARHLYMYIYGGVYADLDTECLRPTEHLEQTYGTLFEQSEIPRPDTAIFGRMGDNPKFEHSIPNAWMAATPGHPVFLAAIQHVMHSYNKTKESGKDFDLPESVTGPVALRDTIAQYEKEKVLYGPKISDAITKLATKGPFAKDLSERHQVLLLPSHLIYPYSWGDDGGKVRDVCWVLKDAYDAKKCKKQLGVDRKGSISITYWSHTHSPSGHSEENMQHIN